MIGVLVILAATLLPPADAPAADVAAALAQIRSAGANGTAAAQVTALLREESPLYASRTPYDVTRLRAQLFVTLAATGVPREALPLVIAELAHGHKPLPLAAAARAAAAAGPAASEAVPHLVRLLGPAFHDEQVSLDEFEPKWPLKTPTNVRIEAVHALAAFGGAASDALPALRELAANRELLSPRLKEEVNAAITKLEPRMSCHSEESEPIAFASAWQDSAQRGPSVLRVDKPTALTFFYTRCDNDKKCSATMSRFAQLQAAASERGALGKVQLLAYTYDPDYDTPYHLSRFATTRGLKVGEDVRLVRPEPRDLTSLARNLGLAVNFADGRPNIHGVELFVLDRRGRVAREYRNVIWNENEVLADLERLLAE
jgi:protein SCO1